MRTFSFFCCCALFLPAIAQSTSSRFIEVQVSDTVRLPFTGMDYEVRMPSPIDLAGASITGDDYSEKVVERALNEGDAHARASEKLFLEILAAGNFTYRKSSTEHAEDYMYASGRTFDVNTYLIELHNSAEVERYFHATEDHDEYVGTLKDQHFGSPADAAPRLMRKLYDQARKEADALVAVTGGHLGRVISAQELTRDEGSFLEQIFKMDKMNDDDEAMRMLAGSHSTTVAFRFELLD